jgi:hypothetical protein
MTDWTLDLEESQLLDKAGRVEAVIVHSTSRSDTEGIQFIADADDHQVVLGFKGESYAPRCIFWDINQESLDLAYSLVGLIERKLREDVEPKYYVE